MTKVGKKEFYLRANPAIKLKFDRYPRIMRIISIALPSKIRLWLIYPAAI